MTLGTAIGRLSRRGIYVRNSETLLDLDKISAVVFDKTGTLTEAVHQITVDGDELSPDDWDAIRAVAQHSTHPISRSISGGGSALDADDVQEIVGQGISGRVGDRDRCYR